MTLGLERNMTKILVLMAVLVSPGLGWADDNLQQALKERAQQYWDAYRINDLMTVYQMESGSLPGGGLTPDKFAGRVAAGKAFMRLENVRIGEVLVKENEGEVNLIVDQNIVRWDVVKKDRPMKDSWVLIDGQWYRRTSPGIGEIFAPKPPAAAEEPPRQAD